MRSVSAPSSCEWTLNVIFAQRLRPLSYSKSHVILIAFAIDTPDSLENVTVKVCALSSTKITCTYIITGQLVD
jgi:hypothetical protein